MKIKTRFQIIVVIFILISGVFVLSILSVTQDMQEAMEKNHITNDIINDVFELNIITHDYLTHPNERAKTQWQLINASLSILLTKASEIFINSEEQSIVEDINQNHVSLNSIFLQLVTINEANQSNGEEDTISQAVKDRLANQLLIKSQKMVSLGFFLSEKSQADLIATRERVIFLSIFSIVFLTSVIILVLFWFGMGVFKSMAIEIKDATYELELLTRELELKNQELSEFTYSVTHDLRAPLRSMQGFSEALLEDYQDVLDDVGTDMIQRINQSAVKMDKMIHDLLLHSQIIQRDDQVHKLYIENYINQAIVLNEEIIKENNIYIDVDLPVRHIWASKIILEQILMNLIGNAIKFLDKKKLPKIRIWSKTRENMVRLTIEDNGIGIEEQYFEKIFQVFERLHSEEEIPGTGIGLSIVKKGVEKMKGRYGVESELGEFTRFWIELPIGE
jgi:signal transduction histidine kinase